MFALPQELEKYSLNSTAMAPYSTIVGGTYSKDTSIGIIYEVKSNPDDAMDTQRNEYKYPEKGKIVLEKLYLNQNIITFFYNGNKKGYFDLLNSKAYFEEYKK